MCGIAGIYDRDKNVLSKGAPLYRMQRILGDRGPDEDAVDRLGDVDGG